MWHTWHYFIDVRAHLYTADHNINGSSPWAPGTGRDVPADGPSPHPSPQAPRRKQLLKSVLTTGRAREEHICLGPAFLTDSGDRLWRPTNSPIFQQTSGQVCYQNKTKHKKKNAKRRGASGCLRETRGPARATQSPVQLLSPSRATGHHTSCPASSSLSSARTRQPVLGPIRAP